MIRTKNEQSKKFKAKVGIMQGCILSTMLFCIILDKAIKMCDSEIEILTNARHKLMACV